MVEDETLVRKLVCETLEAYRYQVIEADSVAHCLQLAADYTDLIHLLLTDVIMPHMDGQELYQQLQAIHPESKVLFMSGYTDNVIIYHSILAEGVNYLQKPFTIHDLAQMVRRVLN